MLVKGEHHEGYDEVCGCFVNVARIVRDKGGKAVMGWLLDRCEDYTSRIHHCVWQKPDGAIVDINPQFDFTLSRQYGEPVAALYREREFEPDATATLVDGRSRCSQIKATKLKFRKWVSYYNLSERAYYNDDWKKANRWTELADRERSRAHKEPYHQSLARFPEGRKLLSVDAELQNYLSA